MIDLNTVVLRHERRIRLVFSNTLAVGAFLAALYGVVSNDAVGASPGVAAAIPVANSPNVVELVLDTDLVNGGNYTVAATAVPAVDASTATGTYDFRYGQRIDRVNVETIGQNRDKILYKVDIIWTGTDFQETATGDLDQVSGTANVTKALYRSLESNGLTWAPKWGGRIREYVDSPATAVGTLRGSTLAQVKRDPRVRNAKVTFKQDVDKTYMLIEPTLKTGEQLEAVSMDVTSDA